MAQEAGELPTSVLTHTIAAEIGAGAISHVFCPLTVLRICHNQAMPASEGASWSSAVLDAWYSGTWISTEQSTTFVQQAPIDGKQLCRCILG